MHTNTLYFITALSFIITPYLKKYSINSGNVNIYDTELFCNIILYIIYIIYKRGRIQINLNSIAYSFGCIGCSTLGRMSTSIILKRTNNIDDVIITSQIVAIFSCIFKQIFINKIYSFKKISGCFLMYIGFKLSYL